MNENRKPIKTEYRGIVFDSKSEAVFARTLDLARAEWVYHPEKHCGHEWDFIVFPSLTFSRKQWFRAGGKYYHSESTYPVLHSKPMLVEYKPSMPTNTYVDNLTEMMRQDPVESVVVWGNPWDGIQKLDGFGDCSYTVYPVFSSLARYGWGDWIRLGDNGGDYPTSSRHDTFCCLGIIEEMAQQARRHRFDLTTHQR